MNDKKDKEIKRDKAFVYIMYWTNRILFPPAKAMFILWTVYWISSLPGDKANSFGQKIFIVLFGYFLICGIADFIYYNAKERYRKYKDKINKKKDTRLRELALKYPFDSTQRDNNVHLDRTESTKTDRNLFAYDSMEGHQFEYFCADILKRNGFTNVEVTQGSGDHGIDILAEKNGITYAIQCKRYSSNIGNAAVQQAYTGRGFYHKDIAVVLTNRYFTPQAKEEAATLGVKLWDRDTLNEMISGYLENEETKTNKELIKNTNEFVDKINKEETKIRNLKYTDLYRKVGLYMIKNNTYKSDDVANALGKDVYMVNNCIGAMIQEGVITTSTYETLGRFSIVMTEEEFLKSIE